MDLKKLGETIRELRIEKGLTQEKLAELADVDPKTVIQIEGGKRKNPTLNTLSKMADIFGVSLDKLLK